MLLEPRNVLLQQQKVRLEFLYGATDRASRTAERVSRATERASVECLVLRRALRERPPRPEVKLSRSEINSQRNHAAPCLYAASLAGPWDPAGSFGRGPLG